MPWERRKIVLLQKSHTRTCLEARRLGICGCGGRTNVGDVYIYYATSVSTDKTERRSSTYCLFVGSRSLSFCSTRTSILLASRYLGMAHIILTATLLLVSALATSTTLPNVPCPSSLTVSSMTGSHPVKPGIRSGILTVGVSYHYRE